MNNMLDYQTYTEYLAGDHWQKVRQHAIWATGGRCRPDFLLPAPRPWRAPMPPGEKGNKTVKHPSPDCCMFEILGDNGYPEAGVVAV